MKKVFFVRHKRDNTPYLLVTVSNGGTDFQPLSDEADDVADVFDSVYRNRPINKQELDAALDDDFTIEGPINPTRGNLNLLQDFLSDANQPLSPRKSSPSAKSFDISSVPLGFSDKDGKVNLTEYKARNFIYEQTKTTFNYEVKRVRAIWDPGLSIPGTGRRGGWRCPVGTRYGGQITDRFGRNCGWGVARRIANAITNIGERMEGLDDRRRGRRVERRNRRMLERLGRAEGAGRAERGLRNVAEALDGGEGTPTPAPERPRGRGVQARRRARNTTEALVDARDRGLRDSERRRVRRELEKPGAARTGGVGERTGDDLDDAEKAMLSKIKPVLDNYNYDGFYVFFDGGESTLDKLVQKGYFEKPIKGRFDGMRNGERYILGTDEVWYPLTKKGRRYFGVTDSRLMDTEEQVDKPKKPQAPRKRPRNARKPAKRPQGEARNDVTKPVGGPNETEDYAGYVNRKYDEYAENVRKIRERGGRAGFLTRREWYDINKSNLDDAWRKKGKGEAPDDFMPPTPAKKRRRQPGVRKKPPVQDKEPTPQKPEPKKIDEEFPNQEPTLGRAIDMLADKGWKREPAPNQIGNKWTKGNWEITLEKDQDGDVFVAKNPETGEIFQVARGAVPLDQQLNQLENLLADRDPDFLNKKPKNKKPKKKKRMWTIDYGNRRPRNRMIGGAGRGENRNIAGDKALNMLTDGELITELERINNDEFMKDWDIRPVERQAIRKNIEAELKYRVDKLPGASAIDNILPKKPEDEAGARGDLVKNEEELIPRAQFDADGQVNAVLKFAMLPDVDSNAPAQLRRRYREVQQKLQDVLDVEKNIFEKPNQNIANGMDVANFVEQDAMKRIDDLGKKQNEALKIAQDDKKTQSERYAAISNMVTNAAKLDGERQRVRQARKYKEDVEKANANADRENPAPNFQNVPFKVYAADATEPNKFMRDANDRADARAELRLMVGEAGRREVKKWEDGQRKKPKMMVMYHNGKAYVAEYDEFKKMTKAEQDEQIKKGIVVWNVNGGMSDTISRNARDARQKLKELFEADLEKGDLKPVADAVIRDFPRAVILREENGVGKFNAEDGKKELRKLRDKMLKDFKDFPAFRVVEVRDEDDNFVIVAIPDDDFRALASKHPKFKKNANKIVSLDGKAAPTRPRKNPLQPAEPDADENNPIGNPFSPKVDKRLDLGIKFNETGIGEYEPIVNPRIKNEADAIKFVKDGGDLSKVPHEYWQAAVLANSSREKVDAATRFRMLSKNGGNIGDTKIFVLRDDEGYGTNQGIVFKAADDNDNAGELIGWNLMHQMGIIKGGAVADGKNERGKRYMILPFAFNDVPNGNQLTDFGANRGEGNYPITVINDNIPKKNQPQMFAARLNQELLNFALGVADRHRGNGMAKAVELPNGEHMAHIVPIDLGWAGRGVQGDPLVGGGVDDRFWKDLKTALQQASAGEKQRIQKAVIGAWDNAIERIGATLEGGKDEFVRNAVKNLDNQVSRARAEKIYDVLDRQRAVLMRRRADLLVKIGA